MRLFAAFARSSGFCAALFLAAGLLPAPGTAQTLRTLTGEPPLIIGHRGAAGHRPDHTLAAYETGIALGADYIEPDIVMTRDGRLICRHEPEIGLTTDVAQKFPARKRTAMIDGKKVEGWFAEDFTLAEIRTLRALQPLEGRSKEWDGQFTVPTLEEVIELALRKEKERGRPVGLYIETKHPTYFREQGRDLTPELLKVLEHYGLNRRDARVFIQSFEVDNLQELAELTPVPLVQLLGPATARPFDRQAAGDPLTYGQMARPEGLDLIARYAAGIGPTKSLILPLNSDGSLKPATRLVIDAHQRGLLVHPYTFRDEDRFLSNEDKGNPVAEYRRFFNLGIDGVFTDFPDTAQRAVR
jgi:glycerophosphoryl diester phosphodiesterase